MSQACIFLLPSACAEADAQAEVVWVRGDEQLRLPFAEALARSDAGWRLVLPVEAVTACAVQLPTQKARWLRQALPFAVEELLAEDVEQMHLALGELLADGRHRVFAVRRAWLAAWLELSAGQPPASIQVDADLLPAEGTQLLWAEQRWLLGGEVAARLSLSDEDCRELCPAFPEPLHIHAEAGRPAPVADHQLQTLADPFAWLAAQKGGCDLAQAEFALQQSGNDWKRWRPLFVAVGLCVLLQWTFFMAQGWHLEREGDAYRQASEALYRELFPEETRLVNLRAQFDQNLASGAGAGSGRLLVLLDQASAALQAEGSTVQVQQLDFSDSRGDLSMQVQAPGFEVLERLRERLIEAGLAVELGSASREAAGVSARVVIGG